LQKRVGKQLGVVAGRKFVLDIEKAKKNLNRAFRRKNDERSEAELESNEQKIATDVEAQKGGGYLKPVGSRQK